MIVYKSNGEELCNVGVRYNGNFLKPAYVEVPSISSPTPVDFEIGDYIDYPKTGLRYRLYSIPQPKKQARSGSYGAAYVYSNVQFFADTKLLERTPFTDLVFADNLYHFSTNPTIVTYEDVYGIARRIEACMNAQSSGWVVEVVGTDDPDLLELLGTPKEFSMTQGETCLSALDKIYSQWKVGWVHSYNQTTRVNTITIGRPNVRDAENTSSLFLYGMNNGLRVIKKNVSSKLELANRIYAYGSTKNMITRYYNGKDIKDAQSVNIPNLMIPMSYWGTTDGLKDPKKAFIEDSPSISKYGLIPKVVYFDNEENGDMYPSIEGVTIKNVRDSFDSPTDEYYPNTSVYTIPGERVDEIKSASPIPDNGIYMTDGGRFVFVDGSSDDSFMIEETFTTRQTREVALKTFTFGQATKGWKLSMNVSSFIASEYDDEGADISSKIVFYADGTPIAEQSVPTLSTRTGTSINIDRDFYANSYTEDGQITAVLYATITASNTTVYLSTDSIKVSYRLSFALIDTFSVRIKQIGFNIGTQSTTGDVAKIAMTSGMCGGRSFDVKSCTYNSETDDFTLVCYRQNDDSLGQYFPNSVYPVSANDRFVITDIAMPERYILIGEARLYDKAVEYLNRVKEPRYTYEPEVDPIVMARSGEVLTEGMYMAVEDEILGGTQYVLISSITIDETGKIPTYKVTLMDEKPTTFLQSIARNVQSVRPTEVSSLSTRAEEFNIWDILGAGTTEQINPSHLTGITPGGGGGGLSWGDLLSATDEQINISHLANALSGFQPLIDSSHKLSYNLLKDTPNLSAYVLKAGDTMGGDLNTHHLIPVTNNAYNLGSAAKIFQYLYARYIMSSASYALRLGIGAGDYAGTYMRIGITGKIALGGDFAPNKSVETAAELGLGGPLFLLGTGTNKRIYFDATHYLELDSNGYLHTNVGFYSDSFITAKGQGSGGGGGGIDVDRMWQELASTGTEQIAIGHLANALGGYQPLIDSSHKLAYSLLSGVPTSLPASDVYAWAKAANKPSYTWNEIGSRPTKLSQFTDDVVSGHYLPIDGKAADSDKLDGYHFGYGNAHESNSNYITARFSRILNLTSLSTSNFYPVTVQIGSRSTWECRIHSQSSSSAAAYNQNWIDFELNGKGWYDSPQGLFIKGYGAYDANEICIGSIGMGTNGGLGVIWLRGGLTYYCESNFVLTEHSSNYSNGDEVYSVGTGFSGGTNARVNVWFTPGVQFPVPAMQFSSGMLRGGFYFQKEVKADGGFIGNLNGRATEADHADVATNADTLDGSHRADLVRQTASPTIPATKGWYTIATIASTSTSYNAQRSIYELSVAVIATSAGNEAPMAMFVRILPRGWNNSISRPYWCVNVEGGSGIIDQVRILPDSGKIQIHWNKAVSYSLQVQADNTYSYKGVREAPTLVTGTLAVDSASATYAETCVVSGGFASSRDIASSGAISAKK